jgi:catechol 2,3-dioxygenase-like lactoylglutathione lyase family enzyme
MTGTAGAAIVPSGSADPAAIGEGDGIMIEIQGIDHVVLRVVDAERMVRFYGEVLGCRVERRQDAIGLIQLRAGSSLIDLVPVDGELGRRGGAAPGAEGRNLDHLCLRVAGFDPEAVKAHLERHGVAVGDVGSRYGAGGEGPSVYLADPEGNQLELRG